MAGLEGVARGRGKVGPDNRPADAIRLPAHSGADQQEILRRLVFERLAELGAHPLGAQLRRPLQQWQKGAGLQRLHAEIG